MQSQSPEKKRVDALLDLAARVFGVDRRSLSPGSRRGDIAEWDSINHIRLAMEAEELLGTRYAIERIPAMEKLEDFL